MSKQVSLRDVARAANVSIGTVSNYLNKSAPVSTATQHQIQKAIDELGYRRNEIASSLRRARTRTLGVIIPNVTNPFYTSLFEGAEQEAQRQGYTITLGVTHYDNATLRQYLNTFYSRRMDGIIIDGYGTYCGEEMLGDIAVPVIVLEPPPDLKLWSTVQIDNVRAAQEAVEYLLGCGHRRIATITRSLSDPRCRGYRLALEKYGIALDTDLVFEFDHFEADLIAQGERAMQILLNKASFTACFITADIFALSALSVVLRAGFQVPKDLAIVGFDNIAFAALTQPPLTTIAQPHHQMGRLAIQMLLQQLAETISDEPVHAVLEHQLVIRGST